MAASIGAFGQPEVFLGGHREDDSALLASSVVVLTGTLATMTAGTLALFAMSVPAPVILCAMLPVPFVALAQTWRGIAIVRRQLVLPAATSGLAAVFRILGLGLLSLRGMLGTANAVLVVQGAVGLAGCGLYAKDVVSRGRRELANNFQWSTLWSSILICVKRGIPVVAFTSLTAITLRCDLIVLDRLGTAEQLGIYSAASALAGSVLVVSGAFKSRIQAAAFGADAVREIFRELKVLAVVAVLGVVVGVLVSPLVVTLLLGPGYEAATPVLRILTVAAAALLFMDTAQGMLAALALRRKLLVAATIGALITVLSLVTLVPFFGMYGAAIATVLGYSGAAAAGLHAGIRSIREDGTKEVERDGDR
ncbi:lipopolysaccharide biosynthesis protein [Gordonia namibiensis]|nr:polysaccharide biosynthesis C-terminal domain-containing protein [Gordonia namibiensis]